MQRYKRRGLLFRAAVVAMAFFSAASTAMAAGLFAPTGGGGGAPTGGGGGGAGGAAGKLQKARLHLVVERFHQADLENTAASEGWNEEFVKRAVATAGILTVLRGLPTMVGAFTAVARGMRPACSWHRSWPSACWPS